jgi:adenine-specific DNA methylase
MGRYPQPERTTAEIQPAAENFRITDDTLGAGGAKAKFHANIEAIRTLQTIEAEGRSASPEEQEVLSRYVGWGGLADAFDDSKPAWANEYKELQSLLSPEEYESARASTLNAHYTSPTVIRAIFEAIGSMGFQTGNILEPACGVGNFFGCLPEEMAASRLYGVELDGITGRIAKQLYPDADITVAGFETTDRRDFYDIAVGNVPFGQYQVNDRAYNKLGFSIHDYFFAKTLDQVRPGGVIAFVTSRYTMDKQSPEVRRYIARRAELLGAIRLPNNAFKANAGTEVVSDILFLQKRDRPIEIEPDWVHLGRNEDGFAINSYFIDHPEMVLGTPTSESTQYGRQDYTVAPIPGADLADQLH